MDKQAANSFLSSLLNKNLRITTTDSRVFYGEFKCTDPDCNVVLAHTFEHRQPPPPAQGARASQSAQGADSGGRSASSAATVQQSVPGAAAATSGTATTPSVSEMEQTARYLGLVVVPGQHIVSIAVEQKDLSVIA